MRALSKEFIADLKSEDGLLHPILDRVKNDNTLMLAVRNGYINIYYRGGNLLRITEQKRGSYKAEFNVNYNITGKTVPERPTKINSHLDAIQWVAAFPHIKELMDIYFSKLNKPEREFQQLIVRENNFSNISNESEYFISDIEFADSISGVRLDLLAVCWPATQRKNGEKCRAALIEMKYGDGALGGSAGLLKHLQDMDVLVSDPDKYKTLLETMESQFNQLEELDLLTFNRCTNGTKVKLSANDKPEVIIILADHNPRSIKLLTVLETPEVITFGRSEKFDLRFHVSSFAGYALHSDNMCTLDQFGKLLGIQSKKNIQKRLSNV